MNVDQPFARVIACLLVSPAALAAQSPPADVPQLSAEECAVWQRELSFARSVAEHDVAAFAEHVGEHAAFGSGLPEPIRGRDAILQRWTALIEGKQVRLRWYPTRVTIGGVSGVAWSSGPALFEHLDPQAEHRFRTGRFHSVWHKDADGVWRVLFDDGTPPRPASAEEVAAFNLGGAHCDPAGSGG